MKKLVQVVFFAAAAGGAIAGFGPAQAAPYDSSGASQMAIGDQIGSSFDQLSLGAVSGTIGGSGDYLLNNVTFTVGVNCTTCTPVNGSVPGGETLTIGGDTQTIALNWSWSNTQPDNFDHLTILGSGPYSFDSGLYTVSVLAASFSAPTPGSQTGSLLIDVVVTPLPAAVLLFGSVVGGAGLFMRRRKDRLQARTA